MTPSDHPWWTRRGLGRRSNAIDDLTDGNVTRIGGATRFDTNALLSKASSRVELGDPGHRRQLPRRTLGRAVCRHVARPAAARRRRLCHRPVAIEATRLGVTDIVALGGTDVLPDSAAQLTPCIAAAT